jgi:MFS family permease
LAPYRILLPVGLGTALSLIGDVSLYTVLPTYTAEAGVLLASVGILLSANRFIRLGTNGLVGWLCDRWSQPRVFVLALFLGALSTAVYAFTRGFWPLLAGRLLWGIAWSGIWIAGNGIVLNAAGIANRGRWVGYYHVAFFLGTSVGALLGGALTDWLGYHQAMAIAAGLALLGALIAWLFLPEEVGDWRLEVPNLQSPMEHRTIADGVSDNRRWDIDQSPISNLPTVEPAAMTRVNVAEMASATALLGVSRLVVAGFMVSTLGLFLLERLGESVVVSGQTLGVATLTGLGLGLSTLLSMLAAAFLGNLSDRAHSRWRIAAAGLIPGIVGFGLMAWGTPVAILSGLLLTAVTSGSNQGLSTALIGDLSREATRGRWLGVLYTVGDLGSAIGPPLAYALIPFWGTPGIYWLSLVILAFMFLAAVPWATLGD